MGLNEALDEAIRATEYPAFMPNQLRDWLVDDWKLKFTAHASPAVPSGADLYAFDTGEAVADVRGVYIPLNLLDLATNPKKTFSKFVERSLNPINPFGGSVFEGEFWTDLDTSVERDMWRNLIKHDTPTAIMSKLSHDALTASMGGPINFSKHDVFAAGERFSAAAGAKVAVADAIDVYEQAGQGVLEFVAKKKSPLTRNGAYSNMQTGFIQAAAAEFVKNRTTISAITLGSVTDLEVNTRINGLIRENAIVGDLSTLSSALNDVEKEISKAAFKANITVGQVQGKMADLDTAITQAQANITAARAAYLAVPDQWNRFNKDVSGLENYLNDLKGVSTALAGRTPSEILGKWTEGEKILTNIAVLSNKYSNTRYGGGISDQYLQSVARRAFDNNSLLDLKFIDPSSGLPVFSDGFRSLHTVYSFQKRAYLQEDARDLLKQAGKGELGKNYLWIARVRDRVQVYTPAYWTAKVMDRTRYFGLVYNEKVTALNPIFDKSPLIRDHYFTERFSVTTGGSVYKFSSRFKASKHLGSFYDAWNKADAGKLIGVHSSVTNTITWGNAAQNYDGFFSLLNGHHAGVQAWVGDKDWANLTTKFGNFKADLQKAGIWNSLQLDGAGNVINNDRNKAILGGLFKKIEIRKLSPAYLDPFTEKFGALQIYTSKLSIIQKNIFEKLKLKKVFDPYVRLRSAAAQRLAGIFAKLASKGLLAAFGIATGGVVTALAPILEKVLQAVVSKVIDKTKDLIGAMLKGDFTGEFNKMMDDAMNATQKVLMVGCIFPIMAIFVVGLLMGTVISAISPTNRASAPSSPAASGGTEVPITPPPPILPDSAPSCVFPAGNWIRTAVAYKTAIEPGHGSNVYYAPQDIGGVSGLKDCSLFIPYFDGRAAQGPRNQTASWCNNKSPQDWFGYALDVVPRTDPVTTWTVAPKLGNVTSWSVSQANDESTGYGCAVTLNGHDGSNNYQVHILHLRCGVLSGSVGAVPASVAPGQALTVLFDYGGNRHAHLEMTVNGVYKKPEDFLCP